MPSEYRFRNHIDKLQSKKYFLSNRLLAMFFLALSAGVFSFVYFKNSNQKTSLNSVSVNQSVGGGLRMKII